MPKKQDKPQFPSELRLDLISKDWVVIATGRGKRPEMFKEAKRKKPEVPKQDCPFCHIETQGKPSLVFFRGERLNTKDESVLNKWTTIVIPNKFPALLPYPKIETKIEGGLYQTITATGYCDLVVTNNHSKQLPDLEITQVKEVFDAYQQRYLDLMKEDFVNYISIFHNHGVDAGASQSHPHSQIITTPLIDIDLKKALLSAKKHLSRTGKCIYCEMNDWEKKIKKRVVFENKEFLAVCPFASKSAFQIIISPKKHASNFELISEGDKWLLAEMFRECLRKMCKALNYPSYNFYLHTVPTDGKKYDYYHWHWTIIPKTSIWAGFEIGTRMEISVIAPEKAAEFLRKQ
ncbi:MAG: Galactose-1-phosphate uridylyltransferase [Parcubacteria group bacterium GW2011_GWA1_36_12]|nr:MAG: Galactose-1-phosphate uridylyltransferase [Parcubacteria group bacterium GW2011_GWA1_36_12]